MTVLGAVTDTGESFYCWTEETLTRHHGIRLLEALQEEFGEELVVFLDRAGYFYARDLWEFVSDERETETVGDSFGLVRARREAGRLVFPIKTARTQPRGRVLESTLRMVQAPADSGSLNAKEPILKGIDAIDAIDEPNIWNYLCSAEG